MSMDPWPATYVESATGVQTGPPLKVLFDMPDSVKDTIVLSVENHTAKAALEMGVDPHPYGPPVLDLAFPVGDARRIALACLHFLADAGDEIAQKMLEQLPQGA